LAQAEGFLRARRFDEASQIYNQILNRNPDIDAAVFGLGCIAIDQGLCGLAANMFRRAIDINPNNLTALMNLGPSLRRCGLNSRAIEVHEIVAEVLVGATHIEPDLKAKLQSDNFGNWSGCYINDNASEKALEIALKGLAIKPEHDNCSNHAALSLMELGRWSEAWPHWEHRVKRPQFSERAFNVPYWDGEPVEVLAIHGEQGVGDEIMFASCLNEAKKKAKFVAVECEHRLIPMFRRSFGVPCYPSPEALMKDWGGKISAKVPLGSLLRHFRPSPDDCPGTPYIKPDPELVKEYKARLDALPGRKVGVTWRGGTPLTHDQVRKVTLDKWGPILAVEGVSFVSLQYGHEAPFEADAHGIHHWPMAVNDLERQAALIAALDLVISVCQSVVHLAGAMGKECWVLTPNKPRWCYGLTGDRMPFYKSVKLYRQRILWEQAVMEVRKDLECFSRSTTLTGPRLVSISSTS
jgi:Tfp pilus assembly protein PilF